MATRDRVLAIANSQKGIAEYPPGSNNNKFTNWYGVDTAWCAIFTMWCSDQADDRGLVPWSASCSAQVREWKAEGRWHEKTATPRRGDLFYLGGGWSGYSHVGFVAAVHNDGSFTSIEGNWQNQVMAVHRSRSNSNLVGFARPDYDAPVLPSTPEENPGWRDPYDIRDVIRSGDTISKISEFYDVSAAAIARRNNLTDPNRVYPGTVLWIPAKGYRGPSRRRMIDVSAVRHLVRTDKREPVQDNSVRNVKWLLWDKKMLPRERVNGIAGDGLDDVYAKWQKRLGYTGQDADGVPGETSLRKLAGQRRFTVRP